MSDLEASFKRASEEVTQLSKAPDNSTKLKLYALYKQASEGDVSGDAPGMFDFVAGAKYNAWKALVGTSKEKAQQDYIALVESLKAAQ
jgi:diazepam-binding inhibitor (GABA receptor modulator, acyl-CoA-binding protein)